MKNLISCFVLIVLSKAVSAQLFTQKDTLRFAPDSSYSRTIARWKNDVLIFATSKSGCVAYNELKMSFISATDPNPDGEFRDLIVDKKKCIYSMVSGANGHIENYCTTSLNPVTFDKDVFYDDLVLTKHGYIILGDPVNGHFFLKYGNRHKKRIKLVLPKIAAFPGEACYAGSGTTAQIVEKNDYCFVSGGGNKARFHRFSLKDTSTYFVRDLPLALGDGAGPFSVCFTDTKNGVAVGGNYLSPNDTTGTAVYSIDGGKTWLPSKKQPGGYRCCVTGNKYLLFCAGTNGIDYSTDGGKTWELFDKGYFCALLLEDKKLYATSNKGYCLRYELNLPD